MEDDKKPADSGIHINLKVKSVDGNEVFFRMKRNTQFKKLMYAYCDLQSVDFDAFRFVFDGRRIRLELTPDELEMEDGDEIWSVKSIRHPSTLSQSIHKSTSSIVQTVAKLSSLQLEMEYGDEILTTKSTSSIVQTVAKLSSLRLETEDGDEMLH